VAGRAERHDFSPDSNFRSPTAHRAPPGRTVHRPSTENADLNPPLPPNAFDAAPLRRGVFHNVSGREKHGLGSLVRWLLTRSRGPWPTHVEDVPVAPPLARVDDGSIRATVIGHATVLVQVAGLNILTDPVLSARIGPTPWLGPRRVRPPAVPFEAIPAIDIVLLSHDHYDHLDRPTLRQLVVRDDPKILTGLRVGARVPSANVVELDWWQGHAIRDGVTATCVPAEHFSGRGLFDRDKTLWGGFVLETPHGRVYFAGDTAAGWHFRAIRERFGPMTLSLLPIGAYAPRWFMERVHMDPDEALQASLTLESQTTLAIHFATFNLADDAYDAPTHALARAVTHLAEAPPGSDFRVLPFGEAAIVRPGEGQEAAARRRYA
jgi:L-ascorbate metabolism protein UlaG (beta-lactamase superfamily)